MIHALSLAHVLKQQFKKLINKLKKPNKLTLKIELIIFKTIKFI